MILVVCICTVYILYVVFVARTHIIFFTRSKTKMFCLHLSTLNSEVDFSEIKLHWIVCCVVSC